jgi:hypothetical protein
MRSGAIDLSSASRPSLIRIPSHANSSSIQSEQARLLNAKPETQPLDDSPTSFGYCHVSAVATADPWHGFDAGCVGKRCRYDHRLDDWNWPIWFHAAEPHGLGWADPGLSVDDDYCGITGTWLGSSECEEMECGWSTGALCPSNRGSLFIGCIRVNGSARNRPSGYCVPRCLALS